MRIAVSATGPSLDAEVDPRFGRCQYFIIVDPQTLEFETVDNVNISASGGAGIATAQMMANKGVQVVLTGNTGPNAYQTLTAAGIQVVSGVSGTVKDAIQGYKAGKFQSSSQPNVPGHFGMGGGVGGGMGMGPGMGRGMGGGVGRGRGMGVIPSEGYPPQPPSPERELESLKSQSQALAQQLSEIQRRIEELEKKAG
ncbi:MAG: hypothetical protein A2Y60_06310 [Chloroflexi bacterium RBG_13_54_9]|nr:MAG: hypothetical protein A2Y60_06310 [Chloroflexi bacterium RBG_13_54_9]